MPVPVHPHRADHVIVAKHHAVDINHQQIQIIELKVEGRFSTRLLVESGWKLSQRKENRLEAKLLWHGRQAGRVCLKRAQAGSAPAATAPERPFGGIFDLPKSLQLSFIGHFFSPLSQTLTLPQITGPGEIFVTDLTGDGTTGDVVPGTNVGSFQRDFGINGLGAIINRYNSNFAGRPTPAGQILIDQGVFTAADLQTLSWVAESLPKPVPHALGLDWLRVFDSKLSWPIKIREAFTIEPSVAIFNLFNFTNFDLPGNTQGGVLSATTVNGQQVIAPNNVGGTDSSHRTNRASLQSGTFALGAPRAFEWGLRVTF